MIGVVHPGSRSRILIYYPSRIQGSKRHRFPDPQHGPEEFIMCPSPTLQESLDRDPVPVPIYEQKQTSKIFKDTCIY
jgi:hypothetical protein